MTIPDPAAHAALASIASIPRDTDGAVFEAPWQAHAFALALSLQERGVFTWAEWAEVLGTTRSRSATSSEAGCGDAYYRDWLTALETIVSAKGLANPETLMRTREAWRQATNRTPHGAPIELKAEDFS
jgi:nitrile hydratase accessory protein